MSDCDKCKAREKNRNLRSAIKGYERYVARTKGVQQKCDAIKQEWFARMRKWDTERHQLERQLSEARNECKIWRKVAEKSIKDSD